MLRPSQIIQSVLAAFFGVQTDANFRRDSTEGNMRHFAIAGAVMTVVFIVILIIIVRIVLFFARG